MVISVASGKGGTGKTTVAVSLALALSHSQSVQFLDCDVEEPNAAIFLKPEITKTQPVGIPIPVVDFSKCTFCGKCAEVCAYNAIAVVKQNVLIFPELCHGCGGCTFLCPEGAIFEVNREIGVIEIGQAGRIEFVQGRLNIGEPMPTPLIREVKKRIGKTETRGNRETEIKRNGEKQTFNQSPVNHLTIIDVSPGTSCPVIEAIKGSDFVVLVTEPTPFGLNDLMLAVETVRELAIPSGVVINRDGIGDGGVEEYCRQEKIPILMRIPMDRRIAETYSSGEHLLNSHPDYLSKFLDLFQKIVVQIP